MIIYNLPEDITFGNALKIAGTNGKLQAIDLSFDFDNRYTLWSGLIGGTFTALSYFGTDQSQVQRYLSAKNMKESQMGMLFNGMLKIPMQFFILMVGVMVFVFYQFNSAPLNFNPAAEEAVLSSSQKEEYIDLQNQLKEVEQEKKTLTSYLRTQDELNIDQRSQLQDLNKQEISIRESGTALINQADENVETNDKDYVFIHFILNNLPKGLIGLLIAVILSAAMSSTASELNALASTTTIDLYKRNVSEKSERHYVNISKLMTLVWGIFAIAIASTANLFDNLIQLVNIIGSIFYGNVLGIFLLAFFIKFIKSNAVFVAALITQVIVIIGYSFDWMPYLWLNIFGCLLVMSIAFLLEMIFRNTRKV